MKKLELASFFLLVGSLFFFPGRRDPNSSGDLPPPIAATSKSQTPSDCNCSSKSPCDSKTWWHCIVRCGRDSDTDSNRAMPMARETSKTQTSRVALANPNFLLNSRDFSRGLRTSGEGARNWFRNPLLLVNGFRDKTPQKGGSGTNSGLLPRKFANLTFFGSESLPELLLKTLQPRPFFFPYFSLLVVRNSPSWKSLNEGNFTLRLNVTIWRCDSCAQGP